MSEYKNILEERLRTLKTEYITTLTNIERVEKDLNEAKVSNTEVLGSIKTLELILLKFNEVKEEKITFTETSVQRQTKEEILEKKDIIDTRPTPKVINNKRKTNREK